MDWYTREEFARTARSELEKVVELHRRTEVGRHRPVHFWLVATLRTWIISATR